MINSSRKSKSRHRALLFPKEKGKERNKTLNMQCKIILFKKVIKIQGVLKRDLRFGGWLYSGKVLAPNVSIVLYRNLLKFLFIKMFICLIENKLFWPKRGTDGFLKIRRPNVEVFA